MLCTNCKYYNVGEYTKISNKSYKLCACEITHIVNHISCPIESDEVVKEMNIC